MVSWKQVMGILWLQEKLVSPVFFSFQMMMTDVDADGQHER